MTRKHYQAIAAILNGAAVDPEGAKVFPVDGETMRQQIAGELSRYFATENPRFDSARFLRAALGDIK